MRKLVAAYLLFSLFVGGFASTAQALNPGRVEFEVFRNGKREGSHIVEAVRSGDGLKVDVKIDLAGRVGPFSYAYTHRCAETWSAGALTRLDCRDVERGKPEKRVTARSEGDGIAVTGVRAGAGVSPAGILPSSWWNSNILRQTRMLDTRTGAVAPITVQRVAVGTVSTAAGPVRATHYRIRGTEDADVWYDDEGRWVKMEFRLRGQRFEYRLKSSPAEAPAL